MPTAGNQHRVAAVEAEGDRLEVSALAGTGRGRCECGLLATRERRGAGKKDAHDKTSQPGGKVEGKKNARPRRKGKPGKPEGGRDRNAHDKRKGGSTRKSDTPKENMNTLLADQLAALRDKFDSK